MWLNRAVAMKHTACQRAGNRDMTFPAIVEYPFFARSELSNGVQTGRSAGLQRLSRLQRRGPGLSVFREGAGELLPAAAGDGTRRSEGLAGPLATVCAGDEGVGRIPTKKPSERRVSDARLGEPYRAHQGHPTTNMAHVDAPVSIPRPMKHQHRRICTGGSRRGPSL